LLLTSHLSCISRILECAPWVTARLKSRVLFSDQTAEDMARMTPVSTRTVLMPESLRQVVTVELEPESETRPIT
jgi:hypothetical protein